MQAIARQPQRAPDAAPVHYERHRSEQSTLYRLVQQHAASFIAHTEASTGFELCGAFGGLSYSATTNYRGLDTLQIATSDLGNSGAGGTLTDTDSVKIYAGGE